MTIFRRHDQPDEDDDPIGVPHAGLPISFELTTEQPAGFTPDYLSGLQFKNGMRAVTHLKSLALQHGFKLSARDAITSDVIRLYCHRSERSKRHKQTTKTNCPFHIMVRWRASEKHFHVTESSILVHNHDLLPPAIPMLPKNIEESAKAMLQIGIGRCEVITYIRHMMGYCPTREQLATLMKDDGVEPLATETEKLVAEVVSQGGESHVYLIGEDLRAAVLTITPFERENLRRFGDVIFLDGTMIRNSLGWTTFPITLINEARAITSGGLLFTAFETQEVFDWLLQTLVGICQGKIQTIFTDEDSALVASTSGLELSDQRIAHRLCTFHKRQNFQQRLQAASRDPAVQAEAMKLFQKVIYAKRQQTVVEALKQLKVLVPTLVNYIISEIEMLLPKLSEAYRGNTLTLGSSTTAASEICNRMLKSGPLIHTFVCIRDAHTRNHELKAVAAQARISNRFKKPHFLQTLFGLELSPAIQLQIDNSVSKAARWEMTLQIDTPGQYVAQYEHSVWRLRYDGMNVPECECNEATGTGLPCPHMIALFRYLGGEECFPVQAIAERWFVKSPEVEFPPLPQLGLTEHDELQHLLTEPSSDGDELKSDEENKDVSSLVPAPIDSESEDGIASVTIPRENQTQRYRRALSLGKEIARRAAGNDAQYETIIDRLREIRDSLTISVGGEIRGATGKPKGRPRRKGHSHPDQESRPYCVLCEAESHNLLDCRHYDIFREEQARFAPDSRGKRHCALCHHPGHRKDNCPVLDIARKRLREEPRTGGRK
jgi:hypothetical protein